jgi:hypothetical protein
LGFGLEHRQFGSPQRLNRFLLVFAEQGDANAGSAGHQGTTESVRLFNRLLKYSTQMRGTLLG